MKKPYEKPLLCIERFTLSQTIAHNCGDNLKMGMANHATKENCGWIVGGIEIFIDYTICDNATEAFLDVCYNAPGGGYNVFNS